MKVRVQMTYISDRSLVDIHSEYLVGLHGCVSRLGLLICARRAIKIQFHGSWRKPRIPVRCPSWGSSGRCILSQTSGLKRINGRPLTD
jgi:hypothetical protein